MKEPGTGPRRSKSIGALAGGAAFAAVWYFIGGGNLLQALAGGLAFGCAWLLVGALKKG